MTHTAGTGSRTRAPTSPLAATARNAPPASGLNRRAATAAPSVRRHTATSTNTSPPTQTAAPATCSARLVTAASWFAAAAACPVNAGGSTAATARTSAARVHRTVVTPAQTVASTSPATAAAAYDRPCGAVSAKSTTIAGSRTADTGRANRSDRPKTSTAT
ncbi:hypothetical protein LG634_03450 [Streptomyces bambusae]|uniref:hypothetical protein n=1 Tax=Streptomyces bambusae TaxID=1550616 RepID=UPI001CFCAAB7|nr:hypothetical protein [Streptomyces bambusae]MCB5163894.1 hypothetical protein [Streptomyces bambusae]